MRISTKKTLCLNHFMLPERDTPLRIAKQPFPLVQSQKMPVFTQHLKLCQGPAGLPRATSS